MHPFVIGRNNIAIYLRARSRARSRSCPFSRTRGDRFFSKNRSEKNRVRSHLRFARAPAHHHSPLARSLYIRVYVIFRVSVRAVKNSCRPEYVSSPINSRLAGFHRVQWDRRDARRTADNFVNNRAPCRQFNA